ncbi:MAG: DUF7344 domain-containing protein [Halodesulfurarchaeum sp.]
MIDRIRQLLRGDDDGDGRTDGGTVLPKTDDDMSGDRSQHATLETDQTASVEGSAGQERSPQDIDQVFEVLKNQRRRYVLQYLTEEDDEVSIGELAEQIAAWEYGKDVRQISSQERKRVYVGLYQCHLPKMDDVGAISYNKPRGNIEAGENIVFFQRYLPSEERPFEPYPGVESAVDSLKRLLSLS